MPCSDCLKSSKVSGFFRNRKQEAVSVPTAFYAATLPTGRSQTFRVSCDQASDGKHTGKIGCTNDRYQGDPASPQPCYHRTVHQEAVLFATSDAGAFQWRQIPPGTTKPTTNEKKGFRHYCLNPCFLTW